MRWFGKIILIVGGLFAAFLILGALLPEQGRKPSEAELRSMVGRIFATCDERILGRQQTEGEHISITQSAAITRCVDEMGGAYLEGVKGRGRTR